MDSSDSGIKRQGRTLSRHFLTSPSIRSCSPGAQDAFPRFLLLADDYGLFLADPVHIKASLYIYRDDKTESDMLQYLQEYEREEMISVWCAGRRVYAQFTNFFDYFHYRYAKKSEIPCPPWGEKVKSPPTSLLVGLKRIEDVDPSAAWRPTKAIAGRRTTPREIAREDEDEIDKEIEVEKEIEDEVEVKARLSAVPSSSSPSVHPLTAWFKDEYSRRIRLLTPNDTEDRIQALLCDPEVFTKEDIAEAITEIAKKPELLSQRTVRYVHGVLRNRHNEGKSPSKRYAPQTTSQPPGRVSPQGLATIAEMCQKIKEEEAERAKVRRQEEERLVKARQS